MGQERYITEIVYLFGSSNSDLREFNPGTFTYPFHYQLPTSIPSSVKAKHGKIRYHVEASLHTGWEFDVYSKTSFTIIKLEDLSYRKDLMVPKSEETVTSFCCWSCKTRPLTLNASIPFSGFVSGQSIEVTIKIDNQCGFDVSRTIISLVKVFTFTSRTPEVRNWVETKILQKIVIGGARSGTSVKLVGVMEIPMFTLPTNDNLSNIVKVSYLISVSLDVVGFIRSPKVKLPIVVGSRPLKFEFDKLKLENDVKNNLIIKSAQS